FRTHYFIAEPDPKKKQDAVICAHAEALQQWRAMAGRAMDGAALYFHLKAAPANLASDGVAGLAAGGKAAADLPGPRFSEGVVKIYCLPSAAQSDAWQAGPLRYPVCCSSRDG